MMITYHKGPIKFRAGRSWYSLAIDPARLGVVAFTVILFAAPWVVGQGAGKADREAGHDMLSKIRSDVQKNYYDPTFRGIDLDAKFKKANSSIDQANSLSAIFSIVAQVLLDFEDSHLGFLPPERVSSVHYGWLMQMIGDKCFVTAVEPNSDAEKQGLKPGDEVVSMDGYQLTRANLWKLEYFYQALRPREGVGLMVKNPAGETRQVDITTRLVDKAMISDSFSNTQRVKRDLQEDAEARLQADRFVDIGKDVTIWRMPAFDNYGNSDVDSLAGRAKKFKSLIVDLRGNGGGLITMLKRVLANFLDHDVKLFDEKRRKETKEVKIESRKTSAFTGKIIVLVDSDTGSAAEVLARMMQLEKRGVVIGDRTAGAVMESEVFTPNIGLVTGAQYGVSVTIADLIMTDGKSLERVGVAPDELMLPTAEDLAAGRDPVLAHAAQLVGVPLTPEQAGTFFPVRWPK